MSDKHLSTRAKLLEAARSILGEQGHAGLRFGTVSERAAVSRGGLLHHFPTKHLLVAAVFENIVQTLEQDSARRVESSGDDGILEAIIEDARARFFSSSYNILLDILISCSKEEALETAREILAANLATPALEGWRLRLESAGLEREDARAIACFLWNLVRGLAIRNAVRNEPEYCDEIIAYGLDLMRAKFDECHRGAGRCQAAGA